MEGIAAAHAIRAGYPGTGVVVLSQYADDAYAFELFKNGTAGLAYLLKDRIGDLDELRAALTAVASGGSCIDPVVIPRHSLLSQQRCARHGNPSVPVIRPAPACQRVGDLCGRTLFPA